MSGLIAARTAGYIGMLGLLIAVTLAVPECVTHAAESEQSDCPVIFQQKLFVDTGDFVYVAGTATGEGIAYKYNTMAISCTKNNSECLVNTMESIGRTDNACQISRLDIPQSYKIEQWTDRNIVATLDTRCGGGETFVIDRQSETAEITSHLGACPGPFEETMRKEKRDLEKMLEERPALAQNPHFMQMLDRTAKALSGFAEEHKKIYRSTLEDPPFWKNFKTNLIKPNVH